MSFKIKGQSPGLFLFVAIWLTLSFSNQADADFVVYDNGAGGTANVNRVWLSDAYGRVQFGQDHIVSDDAMVDQTYEISGIEWAGVYFADNSPPASDDFTVVLYESSANGGPGNPIQSWNVGNEVNRVDSGIDYPALLVDIYEFSAAISFTMLANTNYWISIYNNTPHDLDDDFYWSFLDRSGNGHYSFDLGATWTEETRDMPRMDFRLLSPIPEPAGAFPCFAALAILIARTKRRCG